MFLRKYWIPLSVFIVAIAGVGLYLLTTKPPPELVKIYKVVEPEKPTEQPKAEVTSEPSQDGHFHPDSTWPKGARETPVDPPSDSTFDSDANFKARMAIEKYAAEMAAAKTAREKNEVTMRQIEASPYGHTRENEYNFYKAHPDYDHATASPEIHQKYVDAVYADVAKGQADDAARKAEYERNRYKGAPVGDWIPPQGGNQ